MTDTKLSLKLLVDKRRNRVVLAESQRDFVDVLLSLLTLPLGTIVKVLNKQSLLGSMDMLYKSVEKLDLQFMATKACKTMLLHPRNAAEEARENLSLKVDVDDPRCIYRCPTWYCCTKRALLYSPVQDTKCPKCGLIMDREFEWTKNSIREDGVFVKREGSFTISDGLSVIPTSTGATLSALHRFGVSDSCMLEERNVKVGKEELLKLLKRLLVSETPLTDVFLRKLDVSRDATILGKNQMSPIVKCEVPTETRILKMKLFLSKSGNTLLYAEASGDVVDFLFSFLTYPLGSIVKLLDKCSYVGCLDYLYKSVEELICFDNLVHTDACTTMLLSPELAPMHASASQLLNIQEVFAADCEIPGCQECFSQQGFIAVGTQCKHGIGNVDLSALNPKLPNSGTESGGGFTKGHVVFMITDELEVKHLSSISSIISSISRSGIPISDLEVREVSVGEHEALKLLKASLSSKRVLSDVFCCKK